MGRPALPVVFKSGFPVYARCVLASPSPTQVSILGLLESIFLISLFCLACLTLVVFWNSSWHVFLPPCLLLASLPSLSFWSLFLVSLPVLSSYSLSLVSLLSLSP